jgi:hypothetical protein
VLEGSCEVDCVTFEKDMLVVAKTVEPQPYTLRASGERACLATGVSF